LSVMLNEDETESAWEQVAEENVWT
jgi:hypothetical protein